NKISRDVDSVSFFFILSFVFLIIKVLFRIFTHSILWLVTFWYYSGFGTKLSPFFGFAKSSQIQNQLSIKPIAQIRCSSC
ncbi:hypothetical protein AAEO57_20800, partial [Flavobacterium sp. DGU38]